MFWTLCGSISSDTWHAICKRNVILATMCRRHKSSIPQKNRRFFPIRSLTDRKKLQEFRDQFDRLINHTNRCSNVTGMVCHFHRFQIEIWYRNVCAFDLISMTPMFDDFQLQRSRIEPSHSLYFDAKFTCNFHKWENRTTLKLKLKLLSVTNAFNTETGAHVFALRYRQSQFATDNTHKRNRYFSPQTDKREMNREWEQRAKQRRKILTLLWKWNFSLSFSFSACCFFGHVFYFSEWPNWIGWICMRLNGNRRDFFIETSGRHADWTQMKTVKVIAFCTCRFLNQFSDSSMKFPKNDWCIRHESFCRYPLADTSLVSIFHDFHSNKMLLICCLKHWKNQFEFADNRITLCSFFFIESTMNCSMR